MPVKQAAQPLKITCVGAMGRLIRISASTSWTFAKRAQTLPSYTVARVMVSTSFAS